MKILVFCAKGFEAMEFSVFIDVMGWARNDFDIPVDVETCGFTETVMSTFNVPIIMDRTIDEISVKDYDALAIPGGFEEFDFYSEAFDDKFLELIREFNNQDKTIASICVAALPLGKSGILKNRKDTTYHLKNGYRQKQLKDFGVDVVNERVVVDGNVITSYCPETAADVAFELLSKLSGEKNKKLVKDAMGF
ncbi:protease [Floricoccus tropicus]|uniref:Protease n=1 Tax=Floricoccus tropicus TaxID=1859473 RepID=A0A1E8GMX0_9LACT|nr:DJ-1/PfpI family protein [Floricoccus tropicus]OFI49591.1 protease [Floricoccus tropicus]